MREFAIYATENNSDLEAAWAVLGAELRTQREASGIGIDDLYNRTRINTTFLEAIEAGRFDTLPEAYTRLFLKNYALAVGLDAQDLLARFEALQHVPEPEPEEVPEQKPSMSRTRKVLLALTFLVIAAGGGFAAWQWLQPEAPVPAPGRVPRMLKAPAPPPEPSRQTALINAFAMPTDLPLAKDGATGLELTGRTTASTWIWVWVDDKPVFKTFVRAGKDLSWKADRRLRVEVEKPAAVTLSMGGSPLNLNVDVTHRMRLDLSRFSLWVEDRTTSAESQGG